MVVPTLDVMAEVYRLPRPGGASSQLFGHYLALINEGLPLQPYNPMAGQVTLPTVEELRDLHAERVVGEAAAEVLTLLDWEEPMALCLGVSHPGVWTDRVTSEAENRLVPRRGNGPEVVLLWAGEPVDVHRLRVEAGAQAARAVHRRRSGPPRTVQEAFDQEGWAYAIAGAPDPSPTPEARRVVGDALDVVGDATGIDAMVAVLYGDGAARPLGWPPLGVPDGVGYEVAVHEHLIRSGSAATGPASA